MSDVQMMFAVMGEVFCMLTARPPGRRPRLPWAMIIAALAFALVLGRHGILF